MISIAPRNSLLAALGLLLAFITAPAQAQSMGHHYCWAPDPATDTVHVSPIRPNGPVAERAGYGPAFAAELKARGLTGVTLQAYCTMRTGLAELQRAKAALSRETCLFCQGATRFTEVPWSTDALIPPPGPRAVAGKPVPRNATDAVQPALPPTPELNGPVVVVLGNTETGEVVFGTNKPDLLTRVRDQAFALRESGWKTLLVSTEPGIGLVICEEKQGRYLHHIAHGHDTAGKARAEALAIAGLDPDDTNQKPCKAWRAFAASAPAKAEDPSLINQIQQKLRKPADKPTPKELRRNGSATGVRG